MAISARPPRIAAKFAGLPLRLSRPLVPWGRVTGARGGSSGRMKGWIDMGVPRTTVRRLLAAAAALLVIVGALSLRLAADDGAPNAAPPAGSEKVRHGHRGGAVRTFDGDSPSAAPPGSLGNVTRCREASRWGPICTLAEGGGFGGPAVAFHPAGGTVAAWTREPALSTRRAAAGHVEVRVQPVGGPWGEPEIVPNGTVAPFAMSAMVAMDGQGVVTVAWVRQFEDSRFQLVTATRSTTGAWSAPTIVENLSPQTMEDPA